MRLLTILRRKESVSLFLSGTFRMSNGRYSVPLPFREETSNQTFIGSRAVAMKLFANFERELSAD